MSTISPPPNASLQSPTSVPVPVGERSASAPAARKHSVLGAAGVLALLAASVIGADPYRMRERFVDSVAPTHDAVVSAESGWQSVATLHGVGTMTAAPFAIADGKNQWRVKWTCQSGRMIVQVSSRALPLIDSLCPGAGTGFALHPGEKVLTVVTDGPWRLDVEQHR